jgi:hypothetical protein
MQGKQRSGLIRTSAAAAIASGEIMETANSCTTDPHSPIEERHIDFILEEEFATSPAFLDFFVKTANASTDGTRRESADDPRRPLLPSDEPTCRAIRSVTTSAGESDVLVTYESASETVPRVALLIEDKISAVFQGKQAERYVERGQNGIPKEWDAFWTCLVAPAKYRRGLEGFDARVSLESIRDFFKAAKDTRSQFKAHVIEQALSDFSATGIKKVDPIMTAFRAFYASRAYKYFDDTGIHPDAARDAWFDDTWFHFRSETLPRNSQIIHKAKAGVVQLPFEKIPVDVLSKAFDIVRKESIPGFEIRPVQTHTSSSLQIDVPPVTTFTDPSASEALLRDAFCAVDILVSLWRENRGILEQELKLEPKPFIRSTEPEDAVELAAVQTMLHGLIKARALQFGGPPPDSLPNLIRLASTKSESCYLPIAGMAGGFWLCLGHDANKRRIVYAQSGSGTGEGSMRHKITALTIQSESFNFPYAPDMGDWISSLQSSP